MERVSKERKQTYFYYLLTSDIAFKEIKILSLGDYLRKKYKEFGKNFIAQDKEIIKKRTIWQMCLQISEQLVFSGVFISIIVKTFYGKILLGELTTYVRSINNVKNNVQKLLNQVNILYENVLYIYQFFALIDKKCVVENNRIKINIEEINSVDIKNLSYRYQNKYALKNFSIRIKKNNLIALVGKNGSGKSTLVKVLSNLYQDYEGEILINGINLRDLSIEQLQSKIGVLFQDFTKYELTVRENVAFGDLNKINDTRTIIKALEKTGMSNKIKNIDMQLGFWFDEGRQLSGGEWLKIALSRAFIRDAEMYFLDEPNAALDAVSEKRIFKSFKELTYGKIGIVVTHRISSVKDIADKIVVMNKGTIEACGTHEELLNISSTYRELYYSELVQC